MYISKKCASLSWWPCLLVVDSVKTNINSGTVAVIRTLPSKATSIYTRTRAHKNKEKGDMY